MQATGNRTFKIERAHSASPIGKSTAKQIGFPGWVVCCAVVILSLLHVAGCSRLQLPAIDPTGQSIFLPLPNTTQLAVPNLHSQNGQPGLLPTSAFPSPAAPPACLDGGQQQRCSVCNLLDGDHSLCKKFGKRFESRGKRGEIQLTPKRVVAPVGGEVVLLAGICGEDGYLVKREALEWMLSPDSVGTFIEVGDDSPGRLAGLLSPSGPKVEKLDVDFARGRTSSKEATISRGTPNCNDDIELREGETWLSISSPSEGVSRVTVLAPDSEIWDRRRQTATIYWVDAQWEFPAPQIARSGERLQLVTRVTKAENLVPAEGWIVNYTIVDPSVATFVPATGNPATGYQAAGNQATVKVNADGQAIVQVAAAPGARGTTAIVIEVVRPAQPSDNLPELPIGRGQSLVTFSSPGLDLQTFGPEVATLGEQLTYAASLGNPGDVDAENVRLFFTVPAGTRLVNATPQPSSQTNAGLIWDQGILAARRQLDVSVTLEPLQRGTFDAKFESEGSGGLTAQSSIRTDVVAATINARFAPADGVAQAEIGETVQYEIDITNSGRQTLTDLKVLVESDPGLSEIYQSTNRVEQVISVLPPGATRSIGIAFRVQQEGQLGTRLTVSSGNNVLAEKSASILGLARRPKQPDIGVSIDFPDALRVGTNETALITLRNPGEVRLTDLRVEILFGAEVQPESVDTENQTRFRLSEDGRSGVWTPQDLLPRLSGDDGDLIRRLWIDFRALQPTGGTSLQVRATSAEGVQAQDQTDFQIIQREVEPPREVIPPDNQVRTGGLSITLDDLGDPTLVGRELRYVLRLANDSNQADRNVRIEVRLPQGVRFEGASANGTPVNVARSGANLLSFPTIEYMRPGESVAYVLVVVPTVPQQLVLQSRAYSDAQTTPVQEDEATTVNNPPR